MLERKSGMDIFKEVCAMYEQAVLDGTTAELLTELESMAHAEAQRQGENLKALMEK